MKYQKSSTPYLILLSIIVLGLPLMDYEVERDLLLEYKVTPQTLDVNNYHFDTKEEKLITHSLMHSSNPG